MDTNGMTVMQIVELNEQHLLVIGHYSQMQIYKRVPLNEDADEENDVFNPNVDFTAQCNKKSANLGSEGPFKLIDETPRLHEKGIVDSSFQLVCRYMLVRQQEEGDDHIPYVPAPI